MKRVLLIVIALVIFMLDWLALDDITTNSQSSFLWEYIMLGASVVLTPVIYILWRKV